MGWVTFRYAFIVIIRKRNLGIFRSMHTELPNEYVYSIYVAESWAEDIAEKRPKMCEEEAAADTQPPVCLLVCLGIEANSMQRERTMVLRPT